MNFPPYLQQGDQVVLIAPAGKAPQSAIEAGVRVLRDWGLEPIIGQYALGEHKTFYKFSAPDALRLEDLQLALDNPNIKAIFCVRGGYGTTRLLPFINWDSFKQNRKWLVGFSDITALHCTLQHLETASLHATMPVNFSLSGNDIALSTLHSALFGKSYHISSAYHQQNRQGAATAKLIGGNLSMLVASLGTPYEVNTNKSILFVEEIGEIPYRFDRLFGQLAQSGKLEHLEGLIIGDLLGGEPTEDYNQETFNLIIEHYLKSKDYPISFNFPIGHQAQNAAMICGAMAHLEVNNHMTTLDFGIKFASLNG